MGDEMRKVVQDEPEILLEWSARKLQPVILVWLAAIFLVAMAVTWLTAHTREAVVALLAAGATAIGSAVPSVVNRVEHRATAAGLERRPRGGKKPGEFKPAFLWDDLSHVVPGKHSIKYYKHLDEPNALRRFWKLHISDAWSGEFHAETEDRDDVLALLERLGVATGRTDPNIDQIPR